MDTVPAKTILARTKNTFWFGAEYNMNLYRGCCHGCIYCDSRSDCYHVENFAQVRAKENALKTLQSELSRRTKTGVVSTGSMSDPYNPFEKKELLTRNSLSLLHAYNFGIGITTKSNLIVRDIDILKDIAETSPVICKITITTPHDHLAEKIEPHVANSSARFAALRALSNAGIFCGVLLMPVLPFLQDDEKDITLLIDMALEAGARFIYADFGLTMRQGQREYFYQQLNAIFPQQKLAEKYNSRFGTRYHCSSPKARKLWSIFTEKCQKNGLLYQMPDIIRAYQQPYARQLSLFNM